MQDKQKDIPKAIIKFIDIIIDLYSPVPYQIRNQLRILQSTLLSGPNQQLQQYIQSLQFRLDSKQRKKHHQVSNESHKVYSEMNCQQKQNMNFVRNEVSDNDKQNKFYFNNLRVNVSENLKTAQNSFNLPSQMSKNRKISAVQYINREDLNISGNRDGELIRHPSRTLLKIIKKNRSSKQKQGQTVTWTQRSNRDRKRSENNQKNTVECLKDSIKWIVGIMSENERELQKLNKCQKVYLR